MARPDKAYKNLDFLNGPSARTIRMLCEYEEPQQRFREANVRDTLVFYGSARAVPQEQAIADLSYSLGVPQWFTQAYTRLGARGKFRTLDQYSNRIDAAAGDSGHEWEVMTYVIFGI